MHNAPERIYLQIDPDGIDPTDEFLFDGVTWCQDKINEADVEYARADEIDRLRAEVAELRKDAESAFTLLATMFDAYEDGDECYEDPEDRAGYCGKAIKLDESDFDAIVNLLNKHRPRIAIDAAPSPQEEK